MEQDLYNTDTEVTNIEPIISFKEQSLEFLLRVCTPGFRSLFNHEVEQVQEISMGYFAGMVKAYSLNHKLLSGLGLQQARIGFLSDMLRLCREGVITAEALSTFQRVTDEDIVGLKVFSELSLRHAGVVSQ